MEPEVPTVEPESELIEEENEDVVAIDKIEPEPVEEVHVEETLNDEGPPAKRILKEPEPVEHVSNPIVYSNIIQFLEAIDLDDVADDVSMNGADALPNVRRQLAKHVGISPRDMRVDRMLRLALRLLPQSKPADVSNSKLLAKIGLM